MSDTRRDLFKTSVLGGLGLMSASALAGCSKEQLLDTICPPVPNTTYRGGFASGTWYVFVPNGTKYDAWTLPAASPLAPPDPAVSYARFDLQPWYDNNSSHFAKAQKSDVKFGSGPSSVTVKIDSKGQADFGTLPGHVNVVCSWNEIGT